MNTPPSPLTLEPPRRATPSREAEERRRRLGLGVRDEASLPVAVGRCAANRGLGDQALHCHRDAEYSKVLNSERRLHFKCRWVPDWGGVGGPSRRRAAAQTKPN